MPYFGIEASLDDTRARALLGPLGLAAAAAARLLHDADRLRRARALGQAARHPRGRGDGARAAPTATAPAVGDRVRASRCPTYLYVSMQAMTDMRIDRLRSGASAGPASRQVYRALRDAIIAHDARPRASGSPRTSSPSGSPSAARRCARR